MATQRVTNAFVGPPLGALLFEVNSWLPFAMAAVLSLVSVGGLTQLPGRYQPEQAETVAPFRVQVSMGLRYVWSHPVLRPLALAVATFSFVGAAGNAVFVVLVTERFGLSGFGFGVMMSVGAVSSVLMTFVVASFIQRTSHATSMGFSVVTFTIGSLLFGLTTVADPTWNIVSSTVRQRLVPDEVFGRMMTAYLFIAWGMKPFGALLGGVVAEAWGPQWVSLGAAVAVGSLLVVARPMFRRVDAAMSEH